MSAVSYATYKFNLVGIYSSSQQTHNMLNHVGLIVAQRLATVKPTLV